LLSCQNWLVFQEFGILTKNLKKCGDGGQKGGATTLSITTLRINGLYVTLSIKDILHFNDVPLCWVSFLFMILLNVIKLSIVMLNVVMFNVVMLSVVMLNVVMMSVVVPKRWQREIRFRTIGIKLGKRFLID
jgi:hypothetical protein